MERHSKTNDGMVQSVRIFVFTSASFVLVLLPLEKSWITGNMIFLTNTNVIRLIS